MIALAKWEWRCLVPGRCAGTCLLVVDSALLVEHSHSRGDGDVQYLEGELEPAFWWLIRPFLGTLARDVQYCGAAQDAVFRQSI